MTDLTEVFLSTPPAVLPPFAVAGLSAAASKDEGAFEDLPPLEDMGSRPL